jgi:DNA-binding PadR family transcriptional regulator
MDIPTSSPASRPHRRAITRDSIAILVALADGPKSATELQSQIIADTTGNYVHLNSILTALKIMKEARVVEEKLRVYQLTEQGWHKLDIEARTLQQLAEHAKRRIISSGHGKW